MPKMYKEKDTFSFQGIKCVVYRVTETYRTNILSVKVLEKRNNKLEVGPCFSLKQDKSGNLEIMNYSI